MQATIKSSTGFLPLEKAKTVTKELQDSDPDWAESSFTKILIPSSRSAAPQGLPVNVVSIVNHITQAFAYNFTYPSAALR